MSTLDLFKLDDKVVIVTGASSGLGVEFARAFAEAGADVVLGARRVEKLADTAALVEATGRRALAVGTDVTVPEQCQALVDAAMETFGRVDILINNAGVGTAVPATRETPEEFRSVIDINLNGSYWMAQACAKVMQPGSSVINIASILGIRHAVCQWFVRAIGVGRIRSSIHRIQFIHLLSWIVVTKRVLPCCFRGLDCGQCLLPAGHQTLAKESLSFRGVRGAGRSCHLQCLSRRCARKEGENALRNHASADHSSSRREGQDGSGQRRERR